MASFDYQVRFTNRAQTAEDILSIIPYDYIHENMLLDQESQVSMLLVCDDGTAMSLNLAAEDMYSLPQWLDGESWYAYSKPSTTAQQLRHLYKPLVFEALKFFERKYLKKHTNFISRFFKDVSIRL